MARERGRRDGRGHLVLHAFEAMRHVEMIEQLAAGYDDESHSAGRRPLEVRGRLDEALDPLTPGEVDWCSRCMADELGEGSLIELIRRDFGPFDPDWQPWDDDESPTWRVVE